MREIKFRAWDSVNLKMWFPASFKSGIGVNVPNEYLTHTETDIFLNCRTNGVVFQQYTGLKDKNGVEIYEGDIVNIQGGAFYQGYWEVDEIFEITYDKTTFMLKNKDYKENFWIAENIYVIGNIYENKELLND